MTGLFAEPGRLLLLLAVAGWAFLAWWRAARDARRLALVGDPALVRGLTGDLGRVRRRKDALAALALALVVLAFARPQLGSRMAEVKRRGNDIFVCVDTSSSMSAEDVSPNRMSAAKRSLAGLISMLKGDRVGIVAFAGKAFLQCPLTMDTDAARLFLESVDVGTAPVPGTALGDAVRAAVKRFPKTTRAKKFVVLLTDGEDHGSDPIGAAEEAKKAGVVIHSIGLGTPQGELLRERDGGGGVTGFKKDGKGETVVSRLDEATLSRMAEITGGKYVRGGDDSAVAGLAGEVSSLAREAMAGGMYRVREDRYQWPLLLAVLLLMAEFALAFRPGHWAMVWREFKAVKWEFPRRRGAGPAAVLLALAALSAAPARADFKSLMNEGNGLVKEGKFEEARQKYFSAEAEMPGAGEARYNVANSWLYEGNAAEALKAYEEADKMAKNPLLKSMIAYNRGWAFAMEGDNAGALEAFKTALRWNPGDQDAKYNIEWLKSGKQKGKPQPGKGQAKPGDGKEGGKEKMSREDAERLLEMARGKEQSLRDQKKQKQKEKKEAPGGKDW